MPGRTIFRQSAIEAHLRRRERDVVPRMITRPLIVGSWMLLGSLLGAALLAWSVRVPSYVAAPGLIPARIEQPDPYGAATIAVLFLPPDESDDVHAGRPVHMQVGSSNAYLEGTVTRVERTRIGPAAMQQRYRLGANSNLIMGPSVAVLVRLDRGLPPAAYAGSRLSARVEIGSRRLLSLLSVVPSPVGDAG